MAPTTKPEPVEPDPAHRDRGSDGVAEAVAELAEPGTVVWFRSSSGAEWEVAVGTPVWERLVADGAARIDGPTPPPKSKE